jgi:hypothetical protein
MASEAQLREESESSPPTPTTSEPWGTAQIRDGISARVCELDDGAPFANEKERRMCAWMLYAFEASDVGQDVIQRCPLLDRVDAEEPPPGLRIRWDDDLQDLAMLIMRRCYGGYPPPVATGWHPLLSKFQLRSVGEKWDPYGASQKGKGGKKKGEKPAKKKPPTATKPAANVVPPDPARAPTEPSSRFWGVSWDRCAKRWQAQYTDADSKVRKIGYFDDQEEAARAVNKAIRDAGLEGKRRVNAVDATGSLVPRTWALTAKVRSAYSIDRSAVVAPDPSRAPTATWSKFWGVCWNKNHRLWLAYYKDANGKQRSIGYFNDQEQAARAYNAAIRRAGLEGRRKTNPVVDGQLVPRARKASGHGQKASYKRRREESAAAAAAAAPSQRARRARRAVNFDDFELDDDDDEDLESAPPDDEDGWD